MGLALLGLVVAIAACSGAVNPPAGTAAGASSGPVATPEPSPASGGGSGASAGGGGATGYEGSVTSSGVYAATWSVAAGQEAPFSAAGNPSLTSDKGTFGNIKVMPDGSVSFGSAATELVSNSSYDGTGAKVTLDQTGQFVCAFTIDSDLKGNHDGAVLHLAGGMTFHWHPEGLGGLNCP
jgi:hypothetical protein